MSSREMPSKRWLHRSFALSTLLLPVASLPAASLPAIGGPALRAQGPGCVAHLRIEGLKVDLGEAERGARGVLRDLRSLAVLGDDRARRRLRAAESFVRGFSRSALGRSVASLLTGRVDVGAFEDAQRRLHLVVRARVADAETARLVAQPLRKLFGLEIQLSDAGEMLWSTPACRFASEIKFDEMQIAAAPVALRLHLDRSATGRAWAAALRRPVEDFGAALLVAGLGPRLAASKHLDFCFELDDAEPLARVRMRAPGAWKRLPSRHRRVFGFGDEPLGERVRFATAPSAAHDRDIAKLFLRRDFAAFLETHADYSSQRARDQVQELLSGLELFFRGSVIERDVAPGLGAGYDLTLRRAPAAREGIARTLPVFALRASVHERRLASVLDSLVSVVRLIGRDARMRDGRLPLQLHAKRDGSVRRSWTTVQEPRGGRPMPVRAQFSPAYVRDEQHFAFGNAVELCHALVTSGPGPAEATSAPRGEGARWQSIDRLTFFGPPAAAALARNRELAATGLWLQLGLNREAQRSVLDTAQRWLASLGVLEAQTAHNGDDFEVSVTWRAK